MFRKLFRRSPPPAVAEAVWQECIDAMPFLHRLEPDQRHKLVEFARQFVRTKRFSGAHELEVTDAMRATIGLQACLPVLELGLSAFDDFVEIILYPDLFVAHRSRTDEAGIVHEGMEELAGEAMDGGPVVLSWPDTTPDPATSGSVVIHEFIHKLDMLDGEADGCPPLGQEARSRWISVTEAAYSAFWEQLDEVEASIPIDVDPESAAADPYYQKLPLDPYAATDLAEFFAVSGEVYFTDPERLRAAFPSLFECYRRFFRFDLLEKTVR